jgi:hypothetical protein
MRTSGNRVGVVFGYDPYDGPNAHYYEVQFAPTGEAYRASCIIVGACCAASSS